MYCVHRGKVCIMLYDADRKKWVYIPEREYLKMKGENRK